jgi:ribonuclease BN (tRNA processing enzyme)
MRLVFLGTGDAFNNDSRGNMSFLLDGKYKVLFDCGPQVVYSLRRSGYSVNDVKHLLVSHLHGDHYGGMPFIALNLFFKEKGKMTVAGPKNLKENTLAVCSKFYPTMKPEEVFDFRDISKEYPFKLDIMEGRHTMPDYVYKVVLSGKKIVYTGDTARLDLSEFAKNADYLIHEAAELEEERAIKFGHTTPFDAAETAKEAKVKNLVLVHRPGFDKKTIEKVRKIFPRTLFPHDLDVIEV